MGENDLGGGNELYGRVGGLGMVGMSWVSEDRRCGKKTSSSVSYGHAVQYPVPSDVGHHLPIMTNLFRSQTSARAASIFDFEAFFFLWFLCLINVTVSLTSYSPLWKFR